MIISLCADGIVRLIIRSTSWLDKISSTLRALTLYFSAVFFANSKLISEQATILKLLNKF